MTTKPTSLIDRLRLADEEVRPFEMDFHDDHNVTHALHDCRDAQLRKALWGYHDYLKEKRDGLETPHTTFQGKHLLGGIEISYKWLAMYLSAAGLERPE